MKDNKSSNNNDDNRSKESTLTPPPVPPPTPPPTKNPSSLLSPWWSAEPLPERKKPNDTRRSLIRFTRIVQGGAHSSSEALFTERCYMLTKTKRQRSSSDSNNDVIPSGEDDDCRMGRSSNSLSSWNPFQGLWLVVATTRARCLEHSAGMCVVLYRSPIIMTKNDFPKEAVMLPMYAWKKHSSPLSLLSSADYYTVDLGERWNRSGEDAQRIATIALTPLQHLTQRYIQSWQDGTQAAFLSRFWDSAKRGDAFHLMLDNARKLLHHATAKKDEDTAKKDSK
ncbi:hypothetical protein RO3G_11850 [Lichtheimia corymbifera JMRC:FSU:9682]|uniref:Uncharacterized protein n=1 Tax=Lichtheimia corymbifera JMRC:FSU:9682 TaxID=1263082 RepID=A0A068S5E4_9FUNG|nr:hypothetical protein RO3G_11850 [Lichtheimia corymbifera JMRC:FSU:9682]